MKVALAVLAVLVVIPVVLTRLQLLVKAILTRTRAMKQYLSRWPGKESYKNSVCLIKPLDPVLKITLGENWTRLAETTSMRLNLMKTIRVMKRPKINLSRNQLQNGKTMTKTLMSMRLLAQALRSNGFHILPGSPTLLKDAF